MKWWRFNQKEEPNDGDYLEAHRWTHVVPGDVVQSQGTIALPVDDVPAWDNPEVKMYRLVNSPVLVVSRQPDVPYSKAHTFVCLSRHGLLAVIIHPETNEKFQ